MAKQLMGDKLETMIREQYLPAKLQDALQGVLDIEINAEWLKSPEGRQVEGYTEEEANSVIQKQAEQRARLLLKVEIIKRKINDQDGKKSKGKSTGKKG